MERYKRHVCKTTTVERVLGAAGRQQTGLADAGFAGDEHEPNLISIQELQFRVTACELWGPQQLDRHELSAPVRWQGRGVRCAELAVQAGCFFRGFEAQLSLQQFRERLVHLQGFVTPSRQKR